MYVEVSTEKVTAEQVRKLLLLTIIRGGFPVAESNVWMITGYHDRNDYDGPADDNVELELIMDSRFTKDDAEKIMTDY